MKTSIVIYRPLAAVWECFTTPESWQAWWGGSLDTIVPDWEEGAILRWSAGEPTRLVHFIQGRQVGFQGKWMETVFRFSEAPGEGTLLEVVIEPRSGASFSDGGKGHIEDISAAIDRLKRSLEGTSPEDSQMAIPTEPANVPLTEDAPILRGRSYLALIFSILAIGLIFSLIPCLVVNTFFSGALAAWWWIRREKMSERWYLRRGLLAGMISGLGASIVGVLFFLWNTTETDFSALMLAIAGAMALFMLPAALGGVLTAFVLRARSRRVVEIVAQVVPQPGETAQPRIVEPPIALNRSDIESRMQTSASNGSSRLPNKSEANATRQVVARITTGEEFTFAVEQVYENLPSCLTDHTHRSNAQLFNNILVAVTIIPAWTPEEVRSLLPHGYVSLVQDLADPFKELDQQPHLAHWVFTSDGNLTSVYLTVIPSPDTDKDAPALIARELLSAQEREDLGV